MINKLKKHNLLDLSLKTENSKSCKPDFDNSIAYKVSSAFILPKLSGVYFIHDFRGVLYIGESKNLRQRFLQHIYREENLFLKEMISNPCGEVRFYWFTVSNKYKSIKIQKDWIRFFKPKCNHIKYNKYKEEICQ
tara:strand:+ start:611 stop:1015 length:405 start_codon:yes stop_codon:yes gene_type:complete